MRELKIINAFLVNDGKISKQDIHIVGTKIVKIGNNIKSSDDAEVFDATGKYVFPGLIDDQVHFREPGLTHKATIETESRQHLQEVLLPF
jgi:dihydroorotase